MSEPKGADPPKEDETTATGERKAAAPSVAPVSIVEGVDPAVVPEVDPSTAERARLKDQLLRTAADYDNFRKRSRKEVEEASRRGKEDIVRELLPVADNLERAVAAAEKTPDVKIIVEGVRMVLKLLEDSLDRVGVTRIKAVGERFDPSIHDAIQQVETDEAPPGTIVQELVPGYRMGEKLVRAAMVAVARPPSGKA